MQSNTDCEESASKYEKKNLKKLLNREIWENWELRYSYARNKNNGIEETD